MTILGCGAEMKALMDVSNEDVQVIEDTIAERMGMGMNRKEAQQQGVAEAIAVLAEERRGIMDAIMAGVAKLRAKTAATIAKRKTKADNRAKEQPDAASTAVDLERDSPQPAAIPAVGDPVSPASGRITTATGETGGQASADDGRGQPDAAGVPFGSTVVAGERSNQPVHSGNAEPELAGILAGSDFIAGGFDFGGDGVPADSNADASVEAATLNKADDAQKRRAQLAAERITVKAGDLQNVRDTLPYLLPNQQEDVHAAETRFAKPTGYGMLFTNGTGTGKTFSGLGIVKRFSMQGKGNTLIVVPDDKIGDDWIESAKALNLTVTRLADTKDAGKGIVITTYANLGENDALASRDWDLVIPDEAHSLMQNEAGTPTTYLDNLRAITRHPDGWLQRYTMQNRPDIDAAKALSEQITANSKIMNNDDTMDVMVASLKAENEKLEKEETVIRKRLAAAKDAVKQDVKAKQGAARTRLAGLSATPFAYEKTIDWANGYLFDYKDGYPYDPESTLAYNQPDPRQHFFMTRLGYSMRYNTLTQPDAKIDSGLLQRQFNSELKKAGSLSGRMLDVKPDYDRRFVLVDSAIGHKIDEALAWVTEQRRSAPDGDRGYQTLSDAINDQFKYLQKRYLLEAIKATEVIPIVKKHMAMGRKVVVFHDYKKGGGFNPFIVNTSVPREDANEAQQADYANFRNAVAAFNIKFKDLIESKLGDMDSPIEIFSREIPETMLVNGDQKKKDLLRRYQEFQDDSTGPRVMLVQSAKNKGWSGHDTTGKNQRVLINLGQPTAPTLAIQQEGRIYRTGQASNAIMRYLNTGTDWERWTFASTIATRASAAENLGMGEMARALKDSFIQSFEESDAYPPGHEGEGTGGKERDKAANNTLTEYDRAKTHYWATAKKNSKTKAQEGKDYFATPEPIGLKMAEWLDLRTGEDALEPSAGHGAIARWLPGNVSKTVIEPSLALRSRLAMVIDAENSRIIDGTFEEHHVSNKYAGIAMNPPFGSGGKTAIDHLAQAATHLRDGGRIVAIIPTGPAADKKFEKWFYEKAEKAVKPLLEHPQYGAIYRGDTVTLRSSYIPNASEGVIIDSIQDGLLQTKVKQGAGSYKTAITALTITGVKPTGKRAESYSPAADLYQVADITLPRVAFERAGTAVATRILVIEKQANGSDGTKDAARRVDLSEITDINELFDRLEHLTMRSRSNVEAVAETPAKTIAAQKPAKAEKPAKPMYSEGETVTIDGKQHEVTVYTTNAGKELRGVWLDSRAAALKLGPSTFEKRGLGFFVRERDFPAQEPKLSIADGKPSAYTGDYGPATQDHRNAVSRLRDSINVQRRANGGSDVVLDAVAARPGLSAANRPDLAAVISTARELFATDVVLVKFQGDPLFNGAESSKEPGKLFINVDSQRPVMAVLGHELLHEMRRKAPGIYANLSRRLDKLITNESIYTERVLAKYARQSMSQDVDTREELEADIVGDNFADPEFWAAVAQDQPRLFARIVNQIMQFLDGIADRLTKTRPFGTDQFLTDIQAAREAVASAIREYSGTQVGSMASEGKGENFSLADSLTSGMNNVRDVKLPAGYAVSDLFEGAGRLHWWHKSVGTMYHLAQKSAPFKAVYDSIQNFLNDVSFFAAEAADLAPSILPKLDKLGDVFKSPLSADDTKALSAPVFEGTLTWGRDKNGKAVPMDQIEEALAQVPLDDRAHQLLKDGHIDPKVLKMWQGLPQDQYEAIINGKFDRQYGKAGVVFTTAELQKHFGMNDAQVKLYREFRAATDKSINNLAISEMLNYAGKDVDPIKADIMESATVDEAAQTLRDYLVSQADLQPERDEALSATAAKMLDIAAHATDMKARGYAPLSRFGTFTLEATLDTGERYFSLFETDRERNKMARTLGNAGASGITSGTMSQEAYKLLNGISPETAALFGEMLGLEGQGTAAKDLAFQEFIKRGTANRSAMKRLLKRKGIAGFSDDAGRVLAGFIYSNSRKTSSNLHAKETTGAINDIPKEQGELKDAAVKLQDYVSNPQEEAQAFRGVLFAQYLGGSVASAMVNATQPFTVTLPYLSQFGGIRKAAAQMAAAAKDATKDVTGDARLDAALKHAEEAGIVSPQEVHALMAQSMGKAQLRSGDGTTMGNTLAHANNAMSKVSLAWGKVFGVAEQFNRRITFIAAYRTAVAEGMRDPADFAAKAIAETQFTYNKGNKPRWARGAVGSVLFTFKQYSVNYLELVTRMATAGEPGSDERKAGQKAALFAIAILFLMSGAEGIPFVEDIEDVVDGAMQRLGYNFSSKQSRRAFLATQLGKDGAEFVSSGISGLPGVPIDVSGRLGMGNLLPGTGLFQKKTDHTRDLMEFAGAGGDMVKRTAQAAEQVIAGNLVKGMTTISPVAARNIAKGIDMADTGMYRDESGKKVISSSPGEALAKAIGFQPRSVAKVQEATGEIQRAKAQYTLASGEIQAKFARAIFEDNSELKQDARNDVASWNIKNPDQPIRINMPAVLRRVKEMRKDKTQRIADTAPKAIRAQVRAQLKEAAL